MWGWEGARGCRDDQQKRERRSEEESHVRCQGWQLAYTIRYIGYAISRPVEQYMLIVYANSICYRIYYSLSAYWSRLSWWVYTIVCSILSFFAHWSGLSWRERWQTELTKSLLTVMSTNNHQHEEKTSSSSSLHRHTMKRETSTMITRRERERERDGYYIMTLNRWWNDTKYETIESCIESVCVCVSKRERDRWIQTSIHL